MVKIDYHVATLKALKINLKNRQRTEKEQMSVPDPAMAVKLPPTNPVPTSKAPFQKQKLGIDSYVFRLYCLK
jgi:hypothetical protein